MRVYFNRIYIQYAHNHILSYENFMCLPKKSNNYFFRRL